MNRRLHLCFGGTDAPRLATLALSSGAFDLSNPTSTSLNDRFGPLPAPLPDLVPTCRDVYAATDAASISWTRQTEMLQLIRASFPVTPESVLELMADWPFEHVTSTKPDRQWWPGITMLQGWMLALKGPGHRLFSARMVDRGPWRVLRRGDVTMIQLYDPLTDADTAFEQAKASHELAAPSWRGGHYHSWKWIFRGSMGTWKPSAYDAGTCTSIKVVPAGDELTLAELGIAAGTVAHAVYDAPVERVAIVYLDEDTARRQLPELWLRGIEVRAMTSAGERRIDQDYEPPKVVQPDWVRRLDG